MYHNIIFVGGIHGVGKSTVCQQICKRLGFVYLSASEVLKWETINDDIKNKNVKDIRYTQSKLVEGLNRVIVHNNKYVLDGHFCLFDNKGQINRIPVETFIYIRPILICNVLGPPEETANRLNKRDNKNYNIDTLAFMQLEERLHGKIIANVLTVPYIEIENTESYCLEKAILNLKLNESTSRY